MQGVLRKASSRILERYNVVICSRNPREMAEIIQIYLRDVDRTLIRENLALTPGQRLQKLEEFVEFLESAKKSRRSTSETNRNAKPI